MRNEDRVLFFWFEFSAFFLWAWMLQRLRFVTHWMAQDLTHTGRLLFLSYFTRVGQHGCIGMMQYLK